MGFLQIPKDGKTQRKNEIAHGSQNFSCIMNILGKFYSQVGADLVTDSCQLGNA